MNSQRKQRILLVFSAIALIATVAWFVATPGILGAPDSLNSLDRDTTESPNGGLNPATGPEGANHPLPQGSSIGDGTNTQPSSNPIPGSLAAIRNEVAPAIGVPVGGAALTNGASTPSADPDALATPLAWHLGEPGEAKYRLTSDSADVWNGSYSGLLKPLRLQGENANPFVWQAVSADRYRGSRVRFSAQMKIYGISNGAHLTIRAEDQLGTVIAFDNMAGRWPQGTADWRQYSLVVDIPSRADVLIYGVSIEGAGSLRVDDVMVETVEKSVPLTGTPIAGGHMNQPLGKELVLPSPMNLGFELSTEKSE